ncbi:hypothetical protein BC940DRAFT_337515 [Gongronella butleri]|nr:hypothetical protein BC940DRAFT_337515 [Gongronella butleri]
MKNETALSPPAPPNLKGIALYHHEQVPFTSFPPQSSDYTLTRPREDSKNSLVDAPPSNYELQELLMSYQGQPELLRMILASKLEEDKRRAEEAKLKVKELDLLILQHQQHQPASQPTPSLTNSPSTSTTSNTTTSYAYPSTATQAAMPADMPPSVSHAPHDRHSALVGHNGTVSSHHHGNMASNGSMNSHQGNLALSGLDTNSTTNEMSIHRPFHTQQRHDMIPGLMSPPMSSQHDLLSTLPHHDHAQLPSKDDSYIVPSDASDFLSSLPTTGTSDLYSHHPYGSHGPSHNSSHNVPHNASQRASHDEAMPFSTSFRYDPYTYPSRPRRRREMQPITKIVETTQHPFNDGHQWRNNGNTIQKKTGNKSIYYKCANGIKGCTVNKTVTWRGNGQYIIKYRGEHLAECGRIQRVVQS